MKTEIFAELKGLSEKIATELVFAEAGTDLGLLPINSLLGEMEERLAEHQGPEPLVEGARQARLWIDSILESSGTFSQAIIERFTQWIAWWQDALLACEGQQSPAALPLWEDADLPGPRPSSAAAAPMTDQQEPVVTLNLEQDGELLSEFINESQEHLQNIEQGVLVLEKNPADADTLHSIFRAFHTFKGGSGFLNLAAIQSLAHQLESVLDQARQHKLLITPGVINVILEGGDTLRRFVSEIGKQLSGETPPGPIQVPTLRLQAAIRTLLNGPGDSLTEVAGPSTHIPGAYPPHSDRGDSLTEVAGPSTAVLATKPGSVPAASEGVTASALEAPGSAKNVAVGSAVKVDTQKLDSLVDLVGEMVIAQSLVVQNRDVSRLHNEQLTRDLAQLGRITKDLQRTVMSLRMVPIRATFQKMNRLVRDISAKVGKRVQLVTAGEDTELDRTIVEEISDPLIHMIRNSVDHGIEKPEVRRQRGKPEHGVVSLRAFHQGGNIVIEIKDDGHGLDRERILSKAREKGLVKGGEALSDNQVFQLILGAGFSTAEKVTDLSGRGVGMDVVRRNIEKLRGKLEIASRAGQGSTFSIYLPLTLAIIDGLLVGIGEQRYIVPTLLVRESFRPSAQMINTVHGRGELINVRGHLLPLLRLYQHLGIVPISTDPTESIVVVVEAGTDARCVLVDKLLGKQEVVIKSLGETFRQNRCLAGAAILGDGHVGLILDPQALVHLQSAPLEAAA